MKEPSTETPANAVGWVQDQLYRLKGQMAQAEQQMDHFQSMATKMTESMRAIEAALRGVSAGATLAPRLQEELNQAVALIVQLQDQQGESRERLDALARHRDAEEARDQQDWTDVAKRTDQLERQVASWHDRQAGVDEAARRFQETLSLLRQELQQLEQRLEAAESKSARALEGANRAEHTLTQAEASILDLQREDEKFAERARVAADMTHRLEGTLSENSKELQRIELLAERIELHRAERQRLEDRALRLEEELAELQERAAHGDLLQAQLSAQQQGQGSRLDALQEHADEQRAALLDQFRKLTDSQNRTKRRQIQELERELREMKQYVADLSHE